MINKEDYFELSKSSNVSARCPILNRCERRAHTLAIVNGWEFSECCKLASLKEPIVESVGDPAYMIGGTNNYIAGGLCPEVSLFDSSIPVPIYSEIPVIKAQYDKYMNPQYKLLGTAHFTQCAEYVSAQKLSHEFPSDVMQKASQYISRHHQWIIGTIIAALALLAAFLG